MSLPIQIQGSSVAPRVRWTCSCRQRNDSALPVRPDQPTSFREAFVCRRCRKITVLKFEVKSAPGSEQGE